jgi:MFS family permease
VLAISRASRGRMGNDMAVGILLWSLPLALVAIWPTPAACFIAMALLGLGNPLVDVNFDTIVQRVAPESVMGRVFGAMESCFIATMALGSLVMPFAIDAWGLQTALLVLAAPVVLAGLLLIAPLRRLDAELHQPAHLALFQAIDIFAPLPPAAVETLARGASVFRVPAGAVIVREGDPSDRFYIVESGRVAVTHDGVALRQEGPGDYFGEIGLLRDVPRTATVTAVEDTVLQSVERDEFLSVVTGDSESRSAAEGTVTRRLGG